MTSGSLSNYIVPLWESTTYLGNYSSRVLDNLAINELVIDSLPNQT